MLPQAEKERNDDDEEGGFSLLQDKRKMKELEEDFKDRKMRSGEKGPDDDDDDSEESVLYVDHAGATLASRRQLEEVFQSLSATPLSNPHSMGPLGARCFEIVNKCRARVLEHFSADPGEYDVVFTSGATAALKMIAETFPWDEDSAIVYPYNSHTSVLGMREYAPSAYCVPSNFFHSSSCNVTKSSATYSDEPTAPKFHSLLVTPGECNFSGMKMDALLFEKPESNAPFRLTPQYNPRGLSLPSGWPQQEKETKEVKISDSRKKYVESLCGGSGKREKYLWCLDASKLAATSKVNLSQFFANTPENDKTIAKPHFVTVSFYKMFGYPTGVGALLIRRDVCPLLNKRYFGGGTVSGVAANANIVRRSTSLKDEGIAHTLLEDGTLNYHGIAALPAGFSALARAGGMTNIERYTHHLAHKFYKCLRNVFHSADHGGGPLCEVYGRHSENNTRAQGSIVSFNVRWADGSYVGFGEVGERATAERIQLRVGCFCSIGGCQEVLGISAEDLAKLMDQGRSCQDSSVDLFNGRPTGAVRVSFGYMTPLSSIDVLMGFLKRNFLNKYNEFSYANLGNSGIEQRREPSATDTMIHLPKHTTYLRNIYVYPIKSCAGFSVDIWPLGPTGLLLDRYWAVVNAVTGVALTQKTHPILSLCRPRIDIIKKTLLVSAPESANMPTLELPLTARKDDSTESSLRQVRVCYSQHVASSCGLTSDEWFSKLLGTSCQLVRRSAPLEKGSKTPSSFSNAAQFLLLSMSSLTLLKQKMKESSKEKTTVSTSVESFRPNLVVDQLEGDVSEESKMSVPHMEDSWANVTFPVSSWSEACTRPPRGAQSATSSAIAPVVMMGAGPCARCSMVNIQSSEDSLAVTKNPETLRTLASYRKGRHGVGDGGNDIYFGQYFRYDAATQDRFLDDSAAIDSDVADMVVVYRNMPIFCDNRS